ncbi:MAG: carboxypeptidase-like regulatory domain-containing protein [Planctomycetia bacterium]
MKNPINPLGIPWDEYLAMHLREICAGLLVVILLLVILPFVDLSGGTAVSGTITSQGKPVVFGTVTAITADQRTFTVPINADGSYELKNLPPGPVRIAVSSPTPRPVNEQQGAEPPMAASGDPAAAADRRSGAPGSTPAAGAPRAAAGAAAPAGGVSIAAPNAKLPEPPLPTAARAAQDGWFRIPGRYASPTTSGLGTEVRRGRTTVNLSLD